MLRAANGVEISFHGRCVGSACTAIGILGCADERWVCTTAVPWLVVSLNEGRDATVARILWRPTPRLHHDPT